ncbi:MAG: 23S rRNA (uracil(1939)-C(5))-methyltransferase RlmD [Clostridia bacterium]|nr:23S rRNA (uracil(1939)-C(5))-methyltransferase RlmD [Clostridia bacterium]
MTDKTLQLLDLIPCEHMQACGGCTFQGVPYEDQLKNKKGEIIALLKQVDVDPSLLPEVQPCPSVYHYRNKMEYTFANEIKDGPLTLGMHKRKSFMSVTTIDHCQIVPPEFNEIVKAVLEFCKEKEYDFYHKKSHKGLLRNLVIRKGFRTEELLINIVTSSQSSFAGEEYKERLLQLNCASSITGILWTINDNVADTVKCEELHILYGRDYYNEILMDLNFKVGAFSFFQTNILAAERLFTDAVSMIDSFHGKTVFDLYCGTGTITQAVAKFAALAVGVEISAESVADARDNSKLNDLMNCIFWEGDVLKILDELEHKPDVIVVDPPRSGIHPKAMEKVCSYGVSQILYVSCNPKTMVQNIPTARAFGYEIVEIKAYDNFPFTRHVECVVVLERKFKDQPN